MRGTGRPRWTSWRCGVVAWRRAASHFGGPAFSLKIWQRQSSLLLLVEAIGAVRYSIDMLTDLVSRLVDLG